MGHLKGGERYSQGSRRRTTGKEEIRDARYVLADRIAAALDPTTAPGKVRALADMTEEERAEMRRLYERSAK